jgi:hypothetical protein
LHIGVSLFLENDVSASAGTTPGTAAFVLLNRLPAEASDARQSQGQEPASFALWNPVAGEQQHTASSPAAPPARAQLEGTPPAPATTSTATAGRSSASSSSACIID